METAVFSYISRVLQPFPVAVSELATLMATPAEIRCFPEKRRDFEENDGLEARPAHRFRCFPLHKRLQRQDRDMSWPELFFLENRPAFISFLWTIDGGMATIPEIVGVRNIPFALICLLSTGS
ncbi:MAG: hypothetical protein GXY54_03200 [Deltaproteobacteria bacterium]|nr:hypothetical protein [Deltaproteobacteria bacterium]